MVVWSCSESQCHLDEAVIDRDVLGKCCKDLGFAGWFETSAEKNYNIEASIRFLVRAILAHPSAFEAQRRCQEEVSTYCPRQRIRTCFTKLNRVRCRHTLAM